MANSQIYIHVGFAVQGRQSIIGKDRKVELHKYIMGIIRKKEQKVIAINRTSCHS